MFNCVSIRNTVCCLKNHSFLYWFSTNNHIFFSAEEIATALKATFEKAMAADPAAAADIARALADAMAQAGASVEEIAAIMNAAMASSLMASAGKGPFK
jgi:hypothetical protein